MFVIKIDGRMAAMTNSLDSAVSYAERLKGEPHRVTIRSLLPEDVEPAVHSLLRAEQARGFTLPKAS